MALDLGLDLRQVDLVVPADHLAQQIRAQSGSAARALVRTMIDDPIGRLARPAALPLMPRLGAAGLGLLALLLAIRRGRLGGSA